MPAGGPKTALATEKLVGIVKGSVDLNKTFTNEDRPAELIAPETSEAG
ncbi:hypothetical protein JHN59_02210 [Streptomyces sp. MBT49]|nr:hypothetical protein [Streptomyces sp. MBT49]MBK3623669.1 hypothetical protein [Streptomyces sp. MBT49]